MARERFPLHSFHWPTEILDTIRGHVEAASARLDPSRFEQEPAYVAALIGRLDGLVYDGPEGRVEFIGTVVNDRGPNSAERTFGADFAITASLSLGKRTSHKAVLGQAKRGRLDDLRPSERLRLNEQCAKMLHTTNACVVLQTPEYGANSDYSAVFDESRTSEFEPRIHILGNTQNKAMSLGDYITEQLIVCRHGDHRPEFVIRASNSRLSTLHLEVDG